MEKTDYLSIDGNQLALFLAIHRAGSLSNAGKVLDLNQSTVSYRLEQLRKRLQDPLFVREGNGVRPTKRSEALVPLAEAVLHQLQVMTEAEVYDPMTETRSVRIAATMFERDLLLTRFVRDAIRTAPGVRIEIRPTGSPANAAQDLRDGVSDFTLLPEGSLVGEGLRQRSLLEFDNHVFFDADHPIEAGDLDTYCARPHVRVVLSGDTGYGLDKRLAKLGRKRHVSLQVPDFDSVFKHIEGTPLIATLPSHLVHIAGDRIRHCDSPWSTRTTRLMLFWHERNHHSARHRHWREKLLVAAADADCRRG
ncbi:MAG: LysR family transcriptional regulator [Pseudomonadota bacterium]